MPSRIRSPDESGPTRRGLILGQWPQQLAEVACLLRRAGFQCDMITTRPRRIRARSVHRLVPVKTVDELVRRAVDMLGDRPSIVSIVDEDTIRHILDLPLDDATKCHLLPVNSPAQFGHLVSKIGLSRALSHAGISTPRFRVAEKPEDVPSLADDLGYPVFVKVDKSAGGRGVFECPNRDAAVAVASRGLRYPLLIQERIDGDVLDLSGFYHDGRLVHFAHAVALENIRGPFSPSCLRLYTPRSRIDPLIVEELSRLGVGLGIHGFSNVSCVQAARDGVRYYFEADLRPNVWINHPRYLGDDPAVAIREAFGQATAAPRPTAPQAETRATMTMPYAFRLPIRDILLNRHRAWSFIGDRHWTELATHVGRTIGVSLLASVVRVIRGGLPGARSRPPTTGSAARR